MTKIRIELSSLATTSLSGVANYTKLLAEALDTYQSASLTGVYFNFLNRQQNPVIKLRQPLVKNIFIPLRIYAKLQSYNIAPPFDLLLPKVDLTIFPNFATWPTTRSKFSATVVHDLTYLYYPEVVEDKNLAHLQRVVPRSINKSDIIITVSESVKSELLKEFNLPKEKCIVTQIPPDSQFFNTISNPQIEKVKVKYCINKKYIYFIGNLEPRKNLKTLIEAYQLLPRDIKNQYSLILAGGKGWKTEETEKALSKAIKVGEDIKHLGFINQVDSPALYQGASLFVMPSFYEGFGMPILEAMASGTPVVASDIPVLHEVGGDYITYADPHNPQSFADAIKNSLASQKPSKDILQKNVTRFSWKKNVDTIIDALNHLDNK